MRIPREVSALNPSKVEVRNTNPKEEQYCDKA